MGMSIHLTYRYLGYFGKVRVSMEFQKTISQNHLTHEETHTTDKGKRTNITGQRTTTTTRIPTKESLEVRNMSTYVAAMDVIAQMMSEKTAKNKCN